MDGYSKPLRYGGIFAGGVYVWRAVTAGQKFCFFAAGCVRKWGPETLDMSFWVFDDLRYSNNNGDSGWRG